MEDDFKVNDLVLVRDMASGAFALRYSPNYRIVAIHGPNRIVVRDEKGKEMVRRASHLKVCDLKAKVALVLLDQNEYNSFDRSTKLLLHSNDVPNLQFTANTEDSGGDLTKAEVSVLEGENNIKPIMKGGEISPDLENTVEVPVINVSKKYIAGHTDELVEHSKTSPEGTVNGETDKLQGEQTCFQSPVNCVSNWSKALKRGVINFMGLDSSHTATVHSGEDDKHGFSFFL